MRGHSLRLFIILTLLASFVSVSGFSAPLVGAAPVPSFAFAFGDNDSGQLGQGFTSDENYIPQQIGTFSNAIAVAGGQGFSLVLLADGTVRAFGENDFGQLGDGTLTQRTSPVTVVGLPGPVTAIAAGSDFSLFLLANGTVYAVGRNFNGQLGYGTNADSSTPVQVTGLPGAASLIAVGYDHAMAVVGGVVYSWGANSSGQLGVGTNTDRNTAAAVGGLTGVTAISGGYDHSLAISGGIVYSWGGNDAGQLGDGTYTARNVPTPAVGPSGSGTLANATAVAAGGDHSLVLIGGQVYSFGENNHNKLGYDSDIYYVNIPQLVPNLSNIVAIAAGDDHSMAVRNDGALFTAGQNHNGQTGIGSSDLDRVSSFTQVTTTGGVIAASGGRDEHSLIIVNPIAATTANSLNFGNATVGTNGAVQSVSLANTAGPDVTVVSVTLGGANPGDFSIVGNECAGAVLTRDQSCPVTVQFRPTAPGARTATLVFDDNARGNPRSVTLTGTGVPITVAQFTVTASKTGNGTVSNEGVTSHASGSEASYTATPAAGQVFLGWTLDSKYVGYASPLTFTVAADRTLVATFAARPTFGDIGGLSAQDQQAITFLAALGIVNPAGVNGSGQFQPANDVQRAQVAAFVARVFDWQKEFHANNFPDKCDPQGQNCVDDELWNNVAALKDYGIVGGYSDAATCDSAQTTTPCYLPRDTVKRIQVVSVVARAFITAPDLRPTGFWDRQEANQSQYTNVPNTGTQRSDLTTYRANVGTVPGQTSDANFGDPTGNGTRLYMIQVLYAAFNAQFGVDRVP